MKTRSVGEIVEIDGYISVVITNLHSGYYDYKYTGKNIKTNETIYFDEMDIVDEAS